MDLNELGWISAGLTVQIWVHFYEIWLDLGGCNRFEWIWVDLSSFNEILSDFVDLGQRIWLDLSGSVWI